MTAAVIGKKIQKTLDFFIVSCYNSTVKYVETKEWAKKSAPCYLYEYTKLCHSPFLSAGQPSGDNC